MRPVPYAALSGENPRFHLTDPRRAPFRRPKACAVAHSVPVAGVETFRIRVSNAVSDAPGSLEGGAPWPAWGGGGRGPGSSPPRGSVSRSGAHRVASRFRRNPPRSVGDASTPSSMRYRELRSLRSGGFGPAGARTAGTQPLVQGAERGPRRPLSRAGLGAGLGRDTPCGRWWHLPCSHLCLLR